MPRKKSVKFDEEKKEKTKKKTVKQPKKTVPKKTVRKTDGVKTVTYETDPEKQNNEVKITGVSVGIDFSLNMDTIISLKAHGDVNSNNINQAHEELYFKILNSLENLINKNKK